MKSIIAGVAFVFVLVGTLVLWPFTTVPDGHVGVVVMFGKAQEQPLMPGFSVVNPFAHVIDVPFQVQKTETKGASTVSKDLQSVATDITLNYSLSPSGIVPLYKSVGLDYNNKIVVGVIQDSLKAITPLYTAEELVFKREEVRSKVKESIAASLQRLAGPSIKVEDVLITNFEFSKAYMSAIETKTTQEQLALAEKNKLAVIKYQAEQNVATAEGEAKAMAVKRQQATPEFIKLKELEVQSAAIEKWDGQLPTQLLGTAPMPFVSISK